MEIIKKPIHLRILLLLLVLASIFTLSACDNHQITNTTPIDESPTNPSAIGTVSTNETPKTCQHQWVEADCTFPKTCRLCNKTEGEALGHSWEEATCIKVKTCSMCKATEGTTLEHTWQDATCTMPKTCLVCYKIEGMALGHTEVVDAMVEPTCITKGLTEGKHCSVCNEILIKQTKINEIEHNYIYTVTQATCVDKGYINAKCDCGAVLLTDEIEPSGHSYVQGICEYCGEEDPHFIQPTITANKTTLNLNNSYDVVYITLSGDYTVIWDVDDTNIVKCEWGEWDGYTIPLTFIPVSSGNTFVTVYLEDYDESIIINVTVKMPESTLTIVGVGNKYTTYYSGLGKEVSILHSVEYEKNEYYDDNKVYFNVEVVAELIDSNVIGNDYYRIRYELFDENGVCVQTNDIYFDARYLHRKCSQTFNYYGKAGNYTLKFVDSY